MTNLLSRQKQDSDSVVQRIMTGAEPSANFFPGCQIHEDATIQSEITNPNLQDLESHAATKGQPDTHSNRENIQEQPQGKETENMDLQPAVVIALPD